MADEKAMRFVKDGAVIGGSAALAEVLSDMALRRTSLAPTQRGAVKAVAGCVGGVALASRAPRVAVGLFTFGVLSGARAVNQELQLQRYVESVGGQARSALTSSTGTGSAALGSGSGSSSSTSTTQSSGAVYVTRDDNYGNLYGELRAVR